MTNQYAIEVLNVYKKRLENSCSNQLDEDIESFNIAIKALEERPQGEWISVSEKLPNICGVYNVTKRVIEGGRRYYIAGSCYFDGTGTWHNDNRINFGREPVNCIIAWQPLPEPYKEAEND